MSDIVKHQSNELGEWAALKEQAKIALSSRYLPRAISTPEQAITIAMAGRELGLPPLTAFRSLHLIDGKVTMSADLMAGLVHRRVQGARLDVVHTDNARAVVEAQRPGGKTVTITFSIEDAKAAGLAGKENWKKYPAAMLRARAISAACRAAFPDVFLGVYTPEELEPEPAPMPVPAFDDDAAAPILAAIVSASSEAELTAASDAAKRAWRSLSPADRDAVKAAVHARREALKPAEAEVVPESGEVV